MADIELIVKIPEDIYKKCKWKNNGVVGLEWWERAIVHGTPIDNATNGDVLSSIFNIDIKNKLVHDDITAYEITVDLGTNWTTLRINKDWWNAPYQKGGKE